MDRSFRGPARRRVGAEEATCEDNGIDYVFGLSGTKLLARKVDEFVDDIRTQRAIANLPVVRGYAETRQRVKSLGRASSSQHS